MSSWIEASVARDPALAEDRLSAEELRELQRLVSERNALLGQVHMVEQRLQLLLLVARDRRGLPGTLRVDAETGTIEVSRSIDGQP